jgi:hypothetical protein
VEFPDQPTIAEQSMATPAAKRFNACAKSVQSVPQYPNPHTKAPLRQTIATFIHVFMFLLSFMKLCQNSNPTSYAFEKVVTAKNQ